MAVENKYVVTGEAVLSANSNGSGFLRRSIVSFEVAAADDDGSVYRLAQLNGNMIIADARIANDAITAGTDYDLGFYDVDTGAVVSKDVLLDGGDLSAGHASGSELSAMSNVDVANRGKQIYELLGKTQSNKAVAYDLALTANTVGTAAGTITVIIDYFI